MSLNPRALLGLLPVVAILGGLWFMLLAPARAEVGATQAQVLEATSRRDAAVATASAAEQARVRYPRDYASVARLAQAVPPDEDVAALLRGLDSLARAHKLDVRTIALSEAEAKEPAPAAAPTDPEGGEEGEAEAGAASAPEGGTDAPARSDAPSGTDAATGGDGAAAAQTPAGTAVGTAGLLAMPFTFTAEGNYLPLQRFLKALHARAKHADDHIRVDGRLLTIDGFSFVAGRKGLPQLGALISATAYLEPDPGGVIDRSTPRAPASALASSAVAPPASVGAAG